MVAAIRQIVTVQPGGKIEIPSSELRPGAQAEVIVLVNEPVKAAEDTSKPPLTWASLRGAAKGVYASAEEADAFIRSERDA